MVRILIYKIVNWTWPNYQVTPKVQLYLSCSELFLHHIRLILEDRALHQVCSFLPFFENVMTNPSRRPDGVSANPSEHFEVVKISNVEFLAAFFVVEDIAKVKSTYGWFPCRRGCSHRMMSRWCCSCLCRSFSWNCWMRCSFTCFNGYPASVGYYFRRLSPALLTFHTSRMKI